MLVLKKNKVLTCVIGMSDQYVLNYHPKPLLFLIHVCLFFAHTTQSKHMFASADCNANVGSFVLDHIIHLFDVLELGTLIKVAVKPLAMVSKQANAMVY